MATLGLNSFVSVAEANTYFDNNFNTDEWLDSPEQEKALVTASGILNRLSWKGTATPSVAYPLAFPRNITAFIPLNGMDVTLTDDRTEDSFGTIPTFIKDATCDLALHIIRNGATNIANNGGAAPVRDLTVGSIRLTFDLSKTKSYIDLPEIVYSIISPYLGDSLTSGIGVSVNGGA
ncbi:MAG: DnaT-like ssDNA-binding protein [Bdellovibrionales bacterium]